MNEQGVPKILQKGIDLLAENDLDAAESFFAGFLAGNTETAAYASTYLGLIALRRDDINTAQLWGRRARRLAPGNPDASFVAALAYKALGDTKNALRWCRKTLDLDYNFFEGHRLMADISMPGLNYHEVLSFIHGYLQPDNYLEVGVRFGDSLELVKDGTKAIGIDPEPEVSRPLKNNVRLFKMTSDEFFATGLLEEEVGTGALQLAFVDGMHSFEFALRDFINLEARGGSHTTVMIHDCYPLDEITSLSERMTLFWAGDVWKIIVCLKKYRPDLRINVIKTYPTGLGIVTGLDPANQVLKMNYEKIINEFEEFDFDYLNRNKDLKLNAVDNSLDTIRGLLDWRLQ